MSITKEALRERGFSEFGKSALYSYPKEGNPEVWVQFLQQDKIVVNMSFSDDEGTAYPVANCRTMEQIDQLILLFITP